MTLPDAAVERFVEERRALIVTMATSARDALRTVLSDDRIKTHGLTFSQFSVLRTALDDLDGVLP